MMAASSKLFNMDCMEGMARYPDKYFDVCITDFPYGIGVEYGSFSDNDSDTEDLIRYAMPEILRISKRAVITSGIKMMFKYPKPDWVGAIYSSAGIGCSSHGFCCWQPLLIYGPDPKLKDKKGRHPDSITYNGGNDKESSFHPVPKPLSMWKKVFKRWVSDNDKKVLDPFCGSGTGRIISYDLGLDFVGFELEQKYYELAEKRFQDHIKQLTIF